jgi:hypothetical protein
MRMVRITGALIVVCALSAVTAITALSFVDREAGRVREASDHLRLVNSLQLRLLGLFMAGERVVMAEDGFERFSEMQAAVAKARETLRTRTAGTYLTADVAVLDRDAEDLRIEIQRLERGQATDPRQVLLSYRNSLRETRDAFEADIDSITQKIAAHQDDSLEHSAEVGQRARMALVLIGLIAICMSISFGVMMTHELQRPRRAWTPSEIAGRASLASNRLILVSRGAKPTEPQLLNSKPERRR